MKLTCKFCTMALATLFLASCHENAKEQEQTVVNNKPDTPVWTYNFNDVELGTADFYTFDIERDYSKLNESIYTDPSKKAYVENSKFEDSLSIAFNGNSATVNGKAPAGISVQTNGANVVINTTKDFSCTLTGKSDNGSLKILGDGKVRINLKGLNLKSGKGPAINNQSEKPCFLVTDSISVLADDSLYAEVGHKEEGDTLKQNGCIYCKGKLAISGQGQLKVIAKGADAIHSAKSIFIRRGTNIDIESYAHSAIKAKNNVKIEGGVININSMGRAGHGIAAKKEVEIAGGRTTIISNTGLGLNGKNSRGIKSDSLVNITGGIVRVKESSAGGKGIRAGHLFHAKNCIVDVLTFGKDVSGSKNRGILAVDEIRLDSARVRVRAENGWTEGLSSRKKIIINYSLVELKTRDDAISAGEEGVADIEVNNGRIYADAGMDAVDSNGTIHLNSGLFFVIAHSHGSRGFDCDFKEFKVGPECILVSLGQITSPPTVGLLEHPACFFTRPLSDTQFCLSTTGKNDNIISFKVPKFRFTDTGFRVLLSVPEMKEGVSFDFCKSANIKPKHTFHDLSIGGAAEGKVVSDKHTFTGKYTKL